VSATAPLITYDLTCVISDIEEIVLRLHNTDPYLAHMINTNILVPAMYAAKGSMDMHTAVLDYHSYQLAYIQLVGLKIAHLDTLTPFMTSQELQILDVAKETFTNCTREFRCLHGPTVPSAEDLEMLRGTTLMGEIEKLMERNPFNR
jgi:hypothetical protein